ncbi:MAG: hypothetical protein U0U70_01780 [Chitinophagaceae bacterium]
MNSLDKREITESILIEPEEGERTLLSSNRSGLRSPSLDFLDTSADTVTEDMALEYLAHIIGTIYLKHYHGFGEKESSHILQGVNKRTG